MKVLVPLAEGFEEVEAISIIDLLRRAEIRVDVVGLDDEIVTGRNNIRVLCDKTLSEVNENDYEAIVLPGGNPGYKNLASSEKLMNIVKNFNSKGKVVGAICAASTILSKIGILKGKRATCYPSMKDEIENYVNEKVVIDDNIITSQGPATAIDFALQIIKTLKPEMYDKVKKEVLAGDWMAKKSQGFRAKTRKKLQRKIRYRAPITKFIQEFKIGDKVAIVQEPSSFKGMPFSRFRGMVGEIIEKRGRAYIVKVKVGNKIKRVISRPEHLKLVI